MAVVSGKGVARFRVDGLAAQRFAVAVGDANPLYFDLDAASAVGFSACLAPPTFVTSQAGWSAGPAVEELRYDGVDPTRFPGVISENNTVLGGSQELEWQRHIVQGEELSIHVEHLSSDEQASAHGPLIRSVVETRLTDASGALIAVAKDTLITVPAGFRKTGT
jgi:acyl dehydratase